MKFRYRSYDVAPSLLNPDGKMWRPELDINVGGPNGDQATLAILDTGSDQTVVPRSIAKTLGIVLDDKDRCSAAGVRGDIIPIVPGKVRFRIQGPSQTLIWKATVAFADFPTPKDECILLGYGGCLEFFTVIFDGSNRIVELLPNQSFRGKTKYQT